MNDADLKTRFGKLVRKYRDRRGLTQRDVAFKVYNDEDRSSGVSDVERGRHTPQSDTISLYQAALGIPWDEIEKLTTRSAEDIYQMTPDNKDFLYKLPKLEQFMLLFENPLLDRVHEISVNNNAGLMNIESDEGNILSYFLDSIPALASIKKQYIEIFRPYFLNGYTIQIDEAACRIENLGEEVAATNSMGNTELVYKRSCEMILELVSFVYSVRESLRKQIQELLA
jgi:transcriptional regulator with XRE-family HTH domain